MKFKNYRNNLKLMEKMLEVIKEEGIFADNLGGVASLVTISKECAMNHTGRISHVAERFLRLAALRKIDQTTLELLQLADKCDVDIIDDLLEALPEAYPVYAADMQRSMEYFLGGELR